VITPLITKNNGTLEATQQIANHESPRTTKLYDRRNDEIFTRRGGEDFNLKHGAAANRKLEV
jgi:hypothetical protein